MKTSIYWKVDWDVFCIVELAKFVLRFLIYIVIAHVKILLIRISKVNETRHLGNILGRLEIVLMSII